MQIANEVFSLAMYHAVGGAFFWLILASVREVRRWFFNRQQHPLGFLLRVFVLTEVSATIAHVILGALFFPIILALATESIGVVFTAIVGVLVSLFLHFVGFIASLAIVSRRGRTATQADGRKSPC